MDKKFRKYFNDKSNQTYLNHAAVGMMPLQCTEAMKSLIDQLVETGEPRIEEIMSKLNDFRAAMAQMVTADSDEIAFIHNTTEGLSIALHSIDLKAGDNIIVQADAFPASLYILHHIFDVAKKKYVPLNNGVNFYRRLIENIDSHTRAIVVDHVHFLSGYRLNLPKLGDIAKEHGLYLIVDGIQAVGAIPAQLNKYSIDFYCAGGMKWLVGPMGTGFLYVNQKHFDNLKNIHNQIVNSHAQ